MCFPLLSWTWRAYDPEQKATLAPPSPPNSSLGKALAQKRESSRAGPPVLRSWQWGWWQTCPRALVSWLWLPALSSQA